MTKWKHVITFDTEGLTLIEWYIQELPKFIEKHKDEKGFELEVARAVGKLSLLVELGLSDGEKATISRP